MGYKKHSLQRDYNLRMSKINEEKLNNSVHEFNIHKKQPSTGGAAADASLHELSMQHHNGHSKSLMKNINNDDFSLNDKKKEILDKKRYEQMQKNYNQQSNKASSNAVQMPSVAGNNNIAVNN